MRQAFREIVKSSPQKRRQYLENLRRWREMSPGERERAREQWRQRRGGNQR